jgi:hypothetical protein
MPLDVAACFYFKFRFIHLCIYVDSFINQILRYVTKNTNYALRAARPRVADRPAGDTLLIFRVYVQPNPGPPIGRPGVSCP